MISIVSSHPELELELLPLELELELLPLELELELLPLGFRGIGIGIAPSGIESGIGIAIPELDPTLITNRYRKSFENEQAFSEMRLCLLSK